MLRLDAGCFRSPDPRARPMRGRPAGPGLLPRRATGSLHFEGLVRDLDRLGGVGAVARVEVRALVLDGPALEQVVAHRLLARVVEQDDGDALALHLAVEDGLAPVEEFLRGAEVADDLHLAGLLPARAEVRGDVVAVLVLDDLVLVLQALDGMTTADQESVQLDVEPVGEVEVALGLGRSLQGFTRVLRHSASPSLRPPARARVHCVSERGSGSSSSSSIVPPPHGVPGAHRSSPGRFPPRCYFACPAIWPMRKITNSAGFTGAMPISQTIWPASTTSGGLVSLSHFT